MIKFFRTIRKRLLAESKFSKYMMYAMGEIILVVIGILIAILLNESRIESKNSNQKQTVLRALKLEFESNKMQLDTIIYYNEKVTNAYFTANEMIKNPSKKFAIKDYEKVISALGLNYTFNPSNGALRSAISSSEIHLIENKQLIKILFSWEDRVRDSNEEAQRILKYQYESMPMKLKYISAVSEWKSFFNEIIPSHRTSNFKGLTQSVEFENYSVISYSYAKEYLVEINTIKNQNMKILKLIEEELKK